MTSESAPAGLTIRPFDDSDSDYEASVAIWDANWPDEPSSVEGMRYANARRSDRYFFRRIMGDLEGEVVATAIYRKPEWSSDPGMYELQIRVLPSFHRRGIGSVFYDHIIGHLSEQEPRPVRIASDAREDQPHSVKFLTDRGFKQVQRQQVSRLDLASFDPAPYAETVRRFEDSGIVVKTVEEFEAEDPEARRRMHAAYVELFKDVPLFTDRFELTYELFEKELEGPNRLPGGILLAFDGDEIVGTTSLWVRLADKKRFDTGLTAVARSHRRRGIATALKVRALELARDRGAREVSTDNEENNPMYDLNVRLGFRPTPAWLIFQKEIGEAAG